jgi:uncharacterized phage protein gp47/JayE
MASLQTYTFSQIVGNITTATQAACAALLDFTVGSILRALAQATAAVVLWLQAIILQVLTLTRASTSVGSDLDSWCADFGFARLPAVAASGSATFARFSATQQAMVPVGATVQTTDGTQTFMVTIDTTNSAYNAGLGGYVLPVNTPLVHVPVQNIVGGAAGNIQVNTLTVITTPILGIDTVINLSAFANGIDAESDPAFRSRFVLFLAALSKATKTAIGAAVLGVQQGLNYTLTENQDYNGTLDYGYFYVVVDDGTGSAGSDLLAKVSNAIEAVRGETIRYGVFAPVTETANVAMVLTTATGYTHATVVAAVITALEDFIAALTLGTTLPYTQLASIAYDVPGVSNVTGILLNSGTADLTATAKQRIIAGTMTVS